MKRRRRPAAPPVQPGPAPSSPLAGAAFWLIVAAALAYYALFIQRTSFVIAGTRYYTLFDDAMISMRYARNLAQGAGLVFNPGERPVEGFTNPLWVLLMAAVHWLPIAREQISLVVQALGAGILVAILVFTRRFARLLPDAGSLPVLAGVVLVATYYPLVNWTLQGMEVGLLALIVVAAAWLLLRSEPDLRAGYLLLGLGTWVRMDAITILVALAAAAAIAQPERRAEHLRWAGIAAAVFLGVQTALRLVYFGDLLPNTYYLKMTGYPVAARVMRGTSVLLDFLGRTWGLPLMLAAIAWALARRCAGAAAPLLAALCVFALQCAYSAWVGGDAWEDTTFANRYITVAMPLLLVAGAWALIRAARGMIRGAGGVALAVFLLLLSSPGPAPIQSQLLYFPPPYVDVNQKFVLKALAVNKVTTPAATVGVAAAGAAGYFSDRTILDLLGKCDRHIARVANHVPPGADPWRAFVPGHQKWDVDYTFGRQKPDVILHSWSYEIDARPYLERDYLIGVVDIADTSVTMALRKESPHIIPQAVSGIARPKSTEAHPRWSF